MGTARQLIKRVLDIEIALAALIVGAPLLLLIAVAVRRRHGPPVLFRQLRPGRDERPFALLKFRTMTDRRDERGRLRPNAERLTPLGRRLRASSLDELPALLNVLRGEMSLVGPRPLLLEYLPHYTPAERLRHAVRPGITGLAQVQGRNALAWDEKMELDLAYVQEHTLWLDAGLLARTALRLLRPDPAEIGAAGGDAVPDTLGRPPLKYGSSGP